LKEDKQPPRQTTGYPIGEPGCSGVDTWGHLNRSESGWGNWCGVIAQVCKSWHEAAQKRKRNPSHITIRDWHSDVENWATYRGRIPRETNTSYKTYAKLHSIYAGYGATQSKTQAHELINTLCNLAPTLKKLHMPNTTTEIGLRAQRHWRCEDWVCEIAYNWSLGYTACPSQGPKIS